jgi:signal transduction histidine kinase/photosystem II stability/assembly factor-like uncharacterized protein
MRYFYQIFNFLIFIFISPVFSQNWHIAYSPTHQNLARLDMVITNFGWAVSYDGLILKYNGYKWKISVSLQQIEKKFTDQSDSTSTKIINWGDIYTIRMIDSTNGWIAVNHHKNRIYRLLKYDGDNWEPLPDLFPLKIRALDFWDNSFGIAVGEGGGFLYQNNEWEILKLPISLDFITAKILSKDNIFIAGENGTILHKKEHWSVLNAPTTSTIRDMDFISPEEGWFVGKNGTILHYKQGNLVQEKAYTPLDLWAVDMLSSDMGFIVGKQGVILKYNGKNWESIFTPIKGDLHDIEMVDKNNGWIVGGRGTILKYDATVLTKAQQVPHRFLFMDQVFLGTSHLMDLIDDVQGVAAADFNGDNLTDIYFTCTASLNHLLLNQGKGYYVDFTIESGTGGNIESRKGSQKFESGALVADFDRDGDSDIFLAGKRGTTKLLTNDGNANFKDITKNAKIPGNLNVADGILADFNEDGYPDVLLVDDFSGLCLLMNKKYNRFKKKSLDSLSIPATGIQAITATDFNGDFHTDILIFFHHYSPVLLINDGNSNLQTGRNMFDQISISQFVNSVTTADFNNDGHNDLFLCTENGTDKILIYTPEDFSFDDQSHNWELIQSGRSYSAVAGDFDLDGDLDLYVSRFGDDFLYINENNKRFQETASNFIASKAGYIDGYNTGAATTDIDKDGDLDVIVGNQDHWSSLLENTQNDSNYIILDLKGVEDTHEALGTKIWVWESGSSLTKESLIAFREVNLNTGTFSQNWSNVHIGLGNHGKANVKIRFLNGKEIELKEISKGSEYQVYQSNYIKRLSYKLARSFLLFIHIPYIPFELVKFLFFILLLFFSVRFIEKRYQWQPTHIVVYVLIIMTFYALLTFLLPRSGVLFHVMPFGMILFALLVLVSVNEQIRKTTIKRNQVQKKILEISASLSSVTIIDKAVSLIVKTLQVIHPYHFCSLYVYYSNGNYFLIKKNENIRLIKSHHKVILERKHIDKMIHEKSPIPFSKFKKYWPTHKCFDDRCFMFPLSRDKQMYGILILGLNENQAELDQQTISTMNYLLLQLTITLNNIFILKEMKEREKLAAIGTFSSGIIHNLKNPIDGLRMMIEVLYHDTKPEDSQYEFISELYQGVITLKNTLIHSFDKVNLENQNIKPISLNTIYSDLNDHFVKQNYPPLEFQYDMIHSYIKGNHNLLKLALENIIQNAYDASEYLHSVSVISKVDRRDKTVQIEIKDKGSGIPLNELDKIFDMFYSTREEGRGLGLTISRNIIRNHNGYIDVNSNESTGTIFKVVLPIITNKVDEK